MNRFARNCVGIFCALTLSAGFWACGDGGGAEDVLTDTAADVTGDVIMDVVDAGTDEGQDVRVDVTDNGEDVTCLCVGENECCDGCNPINENAACAMDDVPNCKTAVCQAGTCTAIDVVCEPDNKCLFENGTCNTETGVCEFDLSGALPDGTSCAARDGVYGSGSCLAGVCLEFGECDYRAYDQEAGMPCNFDSECISRLCIPDGFGWDHFCSQRCENAACPEGLRCTKNDDNEFFCMRVGNENYPGDGSIELFKPCNRDEDCAGGLCLGYDEVRFCTMNCEVDGGGAKDNSKCGECGECQDGGTDKGFAYEYYCIPESDGRDGDPCQSPMDCNNHFCYEGYCSNQCFIFGEELDSCPEGFECVPDAYVEDFQSCVIDTSLHKGFGQACAHDYECEQGTCRDVGGKSICVDACDVCSDGECRQIDWIRTDTYMELWLGGSEEAPVTSDNNAGEGNLSKISYSLNQAGDYFIAVKGGDETATGPYVLSVVYAESDDIATESDETEPNDDRDGAEVRQLPVLINAMLEADGQDWIKFPVVIPAEATSVRIVAETLQVPDMACVPSSMDQGADYGEDCVWDWQCATGLSCMEGMCNKTCETDTDCPDGICFAYSDTDKRCVPADQVGAREIAETCTYEWECDEMCLADGYLQQYYCSKACTSDEDCPYGMGCIDDVCNKGFPTASFPYGFCRMDADCESYICVDGMCTTDCAQDDDCEGSEAIVAAGPMDLCASCSTNADCNDGTEDFFNEKYCVQVSEEEQFCTPQCTFNENICPEGTRCYSLDGFTKVCAPIAFTCQAGGVGCYETEGTCIRPYIFDGELCRFDEECYGGRCAQGICRSEQCDGTLECGCDLLECVDSYCVYTAAEGRVLEVEPNNDVESAQELDGIPITVVAGFNTTGNSVIDNDLFKFNAVGGNAYSFVASPACGTDSDPAMLLRDEQGAYIDGWAVDDSATNYFPAMFGYVPENSGVIYVEVVQSPYVDGILRQPYVLDISMFVPDAGDSCTDATELVLADLESGLISTANATSSNVAPESVGNLAGPDIARYIDVPAVTEQGNFSAVTFGIQPDPESTNVLVYAISDCADPAGSLATWSNFNRRGDAQEMITLVNTDLASKRYFVIFDSGTWDETVLVGNSVEVRHNMAPLTIGDSIANPSLHEAAAEAVHSTTVDMALPWTDTVAPVTGACEGKTTTGRDFVVKVSVPDGMFLKASIPLAFTKPVMYILDSRDTTDCRAWSTGTAWYMPENGTGNPVDVFVVLEADGHPGGKTFLETSVHAVGECAGPCDPETAAMSCLENGMLCSCDANSGFWTETDCAANCVAEGYSISGSCHVFSTGESAGTAGCMCDYDCEMEGLTDAMCYYGSYTNCTCSSADPCGWSGDGYCDEFCTNEFEDHFDDLNDCDE